MKIIFQKTIIIATVALGVGLFFWISRPEHIARANSDPGTNITFAAGTYWAWNDIIGWMDFHDTHTITVGITELTGYASSSVGEISLNCNSTSIGSICAASNYQVLNDGNGNLSGWGWNDQMGWISFCGGLNTAACPATTTSYNVQIDTLTGVFSGWAWNDLVGWFSFNCSALIGAGGPGVCGTSQYDVETTWVATSTSGTLESTTYDTGASGGAQLNSFTWKGSQPAGTRVDFQFAGSNATSGPWTYGSVYTVNQNTPQPVDYILHNNYRYFRYKATLYSDQAQRNTPAVEDVILNWSP